MPSLPASDPATGPTDFWRVRIALVLLLGLLVTIVGESISAAGAPEVGVVNDWGRVDEAVREIASWQFLLVALAALVLLGGFNARRVDAGGSQTRHVAMLGVAGAFCVLAAASVLGIVALFRRIADAQPIGGTGFPDYYTESEQLGEAVAYAAILLVAVGLLTCVVMHLRAATATSPDDG